MTYLKKIYRLISAMRTGLILLGLIGIVSAMGTAIKPHTFYHTIPFKLLLVLLFINMTFCTLEQISRFISILRKTKTSNRKRFWSRQFSLLILHLAIVLILIGGIINAYNGQNAQVKIIEGDTVAINDVIDTKHSFTLKVNQFTIEFYEDGSPAQYISDISIMDKRKTQDFLISVNHPLKYQGIKAYQQSYGYIADLVNHDGKKKENILLSEGQLVEFENTERVFKFYKYIPNYDARYGMQTKTLRPDNPKYIYALYEHNHLLGIGAANIAETVQVDTDVSLTFAGLVPYTVLIVKYDPGLLWAAIGGIMLMLGVCCFWFFTSRKKSRKNNEVNGGTINDTV